MTWAILFVALGGGVGAVARVLVDAEIGRRRPGPFPLGTFTINVVGSLILGFVTALTLEYPGLADSVKGPLGTGFCGGFTTFSTASVEVARLSSGRGLTRGGTYALATAVAALAAAFVGFALGSLVAPTP